MKGRALTVIVGPEGEAQAFVIPYLLLRYYSDVLPLLVEHEEKSDQLTLRLPNDLPPVFGLVANWIHTEQYKLPIALESISSTGRKDRVDLCKLLCRTWLVVEKLHIDLLISSVLQDLRNILQHTRNMGFVTPITPGTIFGVFDRVGTENRLWELLMEEMSEAFTRKPRPLFAKYQECFEEIEAFRSSVSAAMADAVCKVVYDKQEEAIDCGSEKTESTLKKDYLETEGEEHLEMSDEEDLKMSDEEDLETSEEEIFETMILKKM